MRKEYSEEELSSDNAQHLLRKTEQHRKLAGLLELELSTLGDQVRHAVEQAEAEQKAVKATLEQQQTLREKGLLSAPELQKTQSDLRQAELKMSAAENALKRFNKVLEALGEEEEEEEREEVELEEQREVEAETEEEEVEAGTESRTEESE